MGTGRHANHDLHYTGPGQVESGTAEHKETGRALRHALCRLAIGRELGL